MDCKKFENELMDLVLTPGATPSVAAVAHLKECPPCTEEYVSFQKTFAVLDSWKAPEPTPYFDQKLAVLLREEQAAPRMGWFESLMTRLRFNTGRGFRPAMAGALSVALIAGGGSIFIPQMINPPVQASATVNDLQILDRNEKAFQQMDVLEQDEDSGTQTNQDAAPAASPTT
jgi:hypothetical protein